MQFGCVSSRIGLIGSHSFHQEPSVDENGEIILAPLPEVEGEFKDFKWSVEDIDPNDLIFGYWTSVSDNPSFLLFPL